jgi:hypothetical protein
MRFSRISLRVLRSLGPVIGAIGCAVALVALAPMAHAHILLDCNASDTSTCPTPTPTPPPTPTPTNAFLSLDVTAGDPNTQITVNGGAFLPNESMTLIWDPPNNKVAGGAVADASGNFTTHVKPFSGDPPGLHRLCASVPPSPCASFTIQAVAVTPTPLASPSPSPDTSPSPTPSPTDTASPTPVAATLSGVDLMMKPPFVILPIIGGAGIAIALIYWILSIVMRPRQRQLKSVAVAHLASRPDYAAGFGTPPPAPPPAAPPPSAWADVAPPAPAPPPPAPPETPAEEPPPAPWAAAEAAPEEPPAPAPPAEPPVPDAAPDEPPDFPEPVDY